MLCSIFTAPTVTPVTIGFERTEYSVSDTANYQFVCAEVHSGSVDGRDIKIVYTVIDNGNDYLGSLLDIS